MRNCIKFLLALTCSALFLYSCESEIESDIQSTAEELIASGKENSLTTDSLKLDSVETLQMTDELKALKERMDELKKTKTRAASNNYDQYFSENMWAIRELPITLETIDGHLLTRGAGQATIQVSEARVRGLLHLEISILKFFRQHPESPI